MDSDILRGEEAEHTSFLLTNKLGGYLMLGGSSRYFGAYYYHNTDMYKVIEDIRIKGKVEKIDHKLWSIDRKREGVNESFFMPHRFNAIIYSADKKVDLDLVLDVKKAYDDRVWGRNYEIVGMEQDCLILKFVKKTDEREDDSDDVVEYDLYIAVMGDFEYEKNDMWEKREYALDKKRGSKYERYVYNSVKLKTDNIIIAYSVNKDAAIREAHYVQTNVEKLKRLEEDYISQLIHKKRIRNENIDTAYKCAVAQLDRLVVKTHERIGVFAGYPWFFQFWSRDELISLKGLIYMEQIGVVRDILKHYLKNVNVDGRLGNRIPSSEIGSADSIGWLFKRINELLVLLSKKKQLRKYFSRNELRQIGERLHHSLYLQEKFRSIKGLAVNGPQETWMDTLGGVGDERSGARIEIQAMRLYMYKVVRQLTKDDHMLTEERRFKTRVKKAFWNGEYLKDGSDDSTIRPNLFIAAYFYPELLSHSEWLRCFDAALEELWLPWGGVSTISKDSKKFIHEYTGENDASYHRGDSWFWVNNLVAIVLHKFDRVRYKDYIDRIVEASTQDILFNGLLANASEVSSAIEQTADGCWSQAWSAAMYIEMVNEIY